MVRILATNTLCAALFALLAGFHDGWRSLLQRLLIALVYAHVIGTAAHLVVPSLGRRLAGFGPTVWWLGVGGALAGLAVVGGLVAGGVAAALGLFGPTAGWAEVRAGVGVALVLTLGAGLLITLYEATRARLDEAREGLRARELETERTRRLAADARLASLEARLHPHFLFNAIAAIAGHVRESPERAERLLLEFADLLRASLDSSGRHTVPLRDEVAIVRAYLETEQARLGERLRATVDVPEDLGTWPVPPFALHTLVQNSVRHVAATRLGGGAIRVEARQAGDRLALDVRDDGPGVDLAAAPPGHGLDTLRARLAALYGAGAGLEAAREAGGARVTLVLPGGAAIAAAR